MKIANFFEQVKTELKKVVWPTRYELLNSTVVVIIATIILGIFVGFCDLVLSRIVQVVLGGAF